MLVSAVMPQESRSGKSIVSSSPAEGQALVLEPVGDLPGVTPILLDLRRQFIGTDADCSIQLPDSSVRSRHAVILRGRRQFIIKAFDRRTWLNGLPVTESLLRDGDRLQAGSFEFRVREAAARKLVESEPAVGSGFASSEGPDLVCRLALRRERLSAIRARLKERREQLRRERASFQAERALFESLRAQTEIRRDAVADTAGMTASAPPGTASKVDLPQREAVARNWERDANRIQHLFHSPPSQASGAGSSDQRNGSAPQKSENEQPANEHAEIATSVNDYMERLLSRRRTERAEQAESEQSTDHAKWTERAAQTGSDGAAADPASETGETARTSTALSRQEWQATESKTELAPATETDGVAAEMLAARGATRARRQVAMNEIRAGVGSLREVANISARTAVARHTSRKLRKLSAVTLVLTTNSFVLVAVFAFLGRSDSRCYGLAFGAMMAGLTLLIEFSYRFWKIRNAPSTRLQPANANRGEISPQIENTVENTTDAPTPPRSSN